MAIRIPWSGSGATSTVSTLAQLATAISTAAAGDTIHLADGTYNFQAFGADISHAKGVRIKAVNQYGAVIVGSGGSAPTTANQEMSPAHRVFGLRTNGAAGAWFEDLHFKYMGVGIDINNSNDAVIQGCKFESCYDAGIQLFDSARPIVHMCEFRDPFFASDTSATLTGFGSVTDAQMDYGVALWGTDAAQVTHNYFTGVFNQACSLKEGNRDGYVGYNTFEGFNLTGLFIGQNKPSNGPYEHTGLPTGPEIGNITAEYNVFRPIQAGGKTYRANIALRVWQVNANVTLRGNVIECATVGVTIEGREGASVGYAAGTVLLTGNVIGGTWKSSAGTLTPVTVGAIRLYKGVPATITLTNNAYVLCATKLVPNYNGGDALGLPPVFTETGTHTVGFDYSTGLTGGVALDYTLKTATSTFDPVLTFNGLRTEPVYVKAVSPINENVSTVQTMFTDAKTRLNGSLDGGSLAPNAITSRELAAASVVKEHLTEDPAYKGALARSGFSARRQYTSGTPHVPGNPVPDFVVASHSYQTESVQEVILVAAILKTPTVAQNYNVKLFVDGVQIVPTFTESMTGTDWTMTWPNNAAWYRFGGLPSRFAPYIVPVRASAFHSFTVDLKVVPTGGADISFEMWTMMMDVTA